MVADDLPQESMVLKDLVSEGPRNSGGGDLKMGGDDFQHLGEAIDNHQDGIVTLGFWKRAN